MISLLIISSIHHCCPTILLLLCRAHALGAVTGGGYEQAAAPNCTASTRSQPEHGD